MTTRGFIIEVCLFTFILDAEALYRYREGSGPIHYSGFHCSGKETQLAHCNVDRNASLFEGIPCDHAEDAGIRCTDGTTKNYGNLLP